MSSHTPLPRQHRKAFSLIEAAIVLGVVGLVIGGIWTAAAVVNDNIRQRQTADGWGYYVSYIGQTCQKSLTAKLTMGADIDLIMGPTVPLPAGWSLTSNRPTDPYGNKLYMSIQPGGQVFTIGYMWQTVGDSACRVAFDFIISRVIDNTLSATYFSKGGKPGCTWTSTSHYQANKLSVLNSCCPATSLVVYATLPN